MDKIFDDIDYDFALIRHEGKWGAATSNKVLDLDKDFIWETPEEAVEHMKK